MDEWGISSFSAAVGGVFRRWSVNVPGGGVVKGMPEASTGTSADAKSADALSEFVLASLLTRTLIGRCPGTGIRS